MCGICGWIGRPDVRANAQVAASMAEAIAHRGPDGQAVVQLKTLGESADAQGWMGHRRLRIIDLTQAADQPMLSADGLIALTFNGEIYNFRSLRSTLESYGHRFVSTGDSEVVLRAYEQWGDGAFSRLDGMFAIALFDGRTSRLLMARDRTGKKPLFYQHSGARVTFASEIKALARAPWVSIEPALERIGSYLVYGHVPGPDTMYRDVRQVPPAALAIYDIRADQLDIKPYWSAVPKDRTAPRDSTVQRIRDALEDAVKQRMIADVPLGALLSGGIDSSVVVSLMARHTAEPIRTFSIGFPDDASYDERPWAQRVAKEIGTQHTEFAVQADAAALMDRLIWHHDGPFGDSSAIPTYLVCEMAREHVTVVLTGDGGDEVFAGYDRFKAAALHRLVPAIIGRVGRSAIVPRLPRRDSYSSARKRLERFFATSGKPLDAAYLDWLAFVSPKQARALGVSENEEALLAPLRMAFAEAEALPLLDRMLHANLRTYLPDDLHAKVDRMSMAHGLEARSPLLDTTLIEVATTIRASSRIGARSVKPVLRRAAEDLIPKEIWNRPKHGFGVPMGRWMRHDLRELVEDELLASDARIATVLDTHEIRRMWDQHASRQADVGPELWSLMTLERWLRDLERPQPLQRPSAPPLVGGLAIET
jgi:asparagine synthase (glutamine-hydrolysing)